jgi:hypothetical protein
MKIRNSFGGALVVLLLDVIHIVAGDSDEGYFVSLGALFVASLFTAYWIVRDRKLGWRAILFPSAVLAIVWGALVLLVVLPAI